MGSVLAWMETHSGRTASRDVQPVQLGPATEGDIEGPPLTRGVNYNTSGHLRLDGHVAVYAERRTVFLGAHVFVELVFARYQHDPFHLAIAECSN